jgi:hypothetical protein
MSAIPLHLQRKFEPRWATRFVPPVASTAPKSTDLKGIVNSLPRPAKAKPAELSKRELAAHCQDCKKRMSAKLSQSPIAAGMGQR